MTTKKKNVNEADRCWTGYKPTPGKKPYEKGSCMKEDEIHEEAEHEGKKVTLNKPFRTPDGPKKFAVYVKNDKGNVVKVTFGDPNMEIKRDDADRRASYRARHNCSDPGPKWKANYWSCKMWADKPVSKMTEGVHTTDVDVSQAAKLFNKFLRTTGAPDKVSKFTPKSSTVFSGRSTNAKFDYDVDVAKGTVTATPRTSKKDQTFIWSNKTNTVTLVEASTRNHFDFDILDGPRTKRKVGAASNVQGETPQDALKQKHSKDGYRKLDVITKNGLIVVKAQWGTASDDVEYHYYRLSRSMSEEILVETESVNLREII